MGHAILERIVKSRDLCIEVTSAGINDFSGTPPADNAWLTCLQNNTPISKMEATFVGDLDINRIDSFLAMEQRHSEVLVSDYGVPEDRVWLLGVFDPSIDAAEIEDPINKPKLAFQNCFSRIERSIQTFLAEKVGIEQGGGGQPATRRDSKRPS